MKGGTARDDAIRRIEMLKYLQRAACIAAMLLSTAASAQNFPSGPVRLIVPLPAGGVTDVMARVLGKHLQEMWGQAVIVENRPGGNTGVGAHDVEKSPPDGLTLLVTADSTFTANPALFSHLVYDPADFTPIAVLCRGTPMLMVHPSLPVKTVPELIAYAKANPGKLSYGSFGVGTYAHLSMEELKQRTGMQLQHVPYRGAAPALTGFLGNEVSVLLLNLSSVEAYVKTGQVRLIAAATQQRVPAAPDLPTIGEAVPGFSTSVWFGLWGPPKMAPELTAKIAADVAKALDLPESKEFFATNTLIRVDLTPPEFGKLVADDLKHWTTIIDAVGAKAE
jgi:tripartite-type tricarboxylate transporter receptor subunit TctC